MVKYPFEILRAIKYNFGDNYEIIVSAEIGVKNPKRHLAGINLNDSRIDSTNPDLSLTKIIIRNSNGRDFKLTKEEFKKYKQEEDREELIQKINEFFSN